MEENKIEIYRSADGKVELSVKLEKGTVWLTQNQMAELFGVDRTSIVRHIKNIYKAEELDEVSTCAKNAQVRFEGNRKIVREMAFYNLDMVISVGYRVNSKKATSFRKWATSEKSLTTAQRGSGLRRAAPCHVQTPHRNHQESDSVTFLIYRYIDRYTMPILSKKQ